MLDKFKKMNWKLVAGIVFVILMIGVAVVIANPQSNGATKQTQQTVVVQRGNLTAAVTGSGTIAAESTIELSFETSGTVKEVLVSEGDTVQASQVLAKLDDRTLLAEITSAQAKLTSAQAQFGKTKQGATADETASVQAALQSAQAAYDKALKEAETADLDVASAKLTMDKAQVAVGTAQAAYDRIGGASNPMIGMTSQAKDLQNATLEYQNAVTTYQTKFQRLETSKKSTVASAKSTLETAKYNLANQQVRSEDLAIDQASIDQADQALKQAQINL
jgi:HlyD family secretion protein